MIAFVRRLIRRSTSLRFRVNVSRVTSAKIGVAPQSETALAVGLPANKRAAKTGGGIAQRARIELESKTGRKVVTGENYLPPSKTKKGLKA